MNATDRASILKGRELLDNSVHNRGTAFPKAERDRLGLRGLLPPAVETLEEQVARVIANCARKESDLEKYIFLMALLDQNETLFYRTITDHLSDYMPIIYTPTVGEAAREFGQIFRRSRGLYVSARDKGSIGRVLKNWPESEVRVIVVTDGQRILGLGDLGANGMSIPIGKLSLYTAAGGIPPTQTLPVLLDVGTDNEALRNHPVYLGLPQERLTGDAYLEFLDEFMTAVEKVFPRALIQFEDFATQNALLLLDRYRGRTACFNDDIQGTAAVVLAGILVGMRLTRMELRDQRVLFLGAGSAALGIAGLLVQGLVEDGLSIEAARKRCWFMNTKGLVIKTRTDLRPQLQTYAHEHHPVTDLTEAIRAVKPTVLIGATGTPGTFTQPALEAMAAINARPMVFALSNPTTRAECTAEEAYAWTGGKAIFAGGSPFDPVRGYGHTRVPGQANNVYIFPGLGLGVVVSGISRVTDEMFLAAAKALAAEVTEASLAQDCLYPPLENIREVSRTIAVAVSRVAEGQGLCPSPCPADLDIRMEDAMYVPRYPDP